MMIFSIFNPALAAQGAEPISAYHAEFSAQVDWFSAALSHIAGKLQRIERNPLLPDASVHCFLYEPRAGVANQTVHELEGFAYQLSAPTLVVSSYIDGKESIWSLAVMSALLDRLNGRPLGQPLLIVLVDQRQATQLDSFDVYAAFPSLAELLILDFRSHPGQVNIEAESSRLLADFRFLNRLRQNLSDSQQPFREAVFESLFLSLGLYHKHTIVDEMLDAGLSAIRLSSLPEQAPKAENHEAGLVAALTGLVDRENSPAEPEFNYLRFSLFRRLIVLNERTIIILVFGLTLLVLALLLFRGIFMHSGWSRIFFGSPSRKGTDKNVAANMPERLARLLSNQERSTVKRGTRLLPLLEALIVVALCFISLNLGRFLLNSLSGLFFSTSDRAVARSPQILFYIRTIFYIAFFFLLYGLLDSFKLVPRMRRSAALQAGAGLLLVDSLALGYFAFNYTLFLLVPAVLMLTAANFRPVSVLALAAISIPLVVLGRELYLYYPQQVLLAVINPGIRESIYLSLFFSPFILWAGSLLSRRDHFQRGSRILLLMAFLSLISLVTELAYTAVLLYKAG